MFFQQQVISIPQKKIKSKALRDNEISHINLTRIMNEEKKYYKPKKSIRMIKSQAIIRQKMVKDWLLMRLFRK